MLIFTSCTLNLFLARLFCDSDFNTIQCEVQQLLMLSCIYQIGEQTLIDGLKPLAFLSSFPSRLDVVCVTLIRGRGSGGIHYYPVKERKMKGGEGLYVCGRKSWVFFLCFCFLLGFFRGVCFFFFFFFFFFLEGGGWITGYKDIPKEVKSVDIELSMVFYVLHV